jgi:hypothetical protein
MHGRFDVGIKRRCDAYGETCNCIEKSGRIDGLRDVELKSRSQRMRGIRSQKLSSPPLATTDVHIIIIIWSQHRVVPELVRTPR